MTAYSGSIYIDRSPAASAFAAAIPFAFGVCFVTTAVCVAIGVYSALFAPTQLDRLLIVSAVTGIAAAIAVASPSHLVDLFLVVVVVNRLLRRLLDWGSGRFDETPLLSLLPMVVAGTMLLFVLARWDSLPRQVRKATVLLFAAILYGILVGIRTKMAAFYAATEYALPFVVCLFCASCRPTTQLLNRWVAVLLGLSGMAAIYGFVQWSLVPPWDASWLEWSGMYSSMGSASPFQLSIASTLESRGPASWFFATTAVIALGVQHIRSRGGVVVGALGAMAMLLTRARTALVFLTLALLIAAVLQGRKGGVRVIVLMCSLAGLSIAVMSRFEEAAPLVDRVATLSNLAEDGSTNLRAQIARDGIKAVIVNPLGSGLGSGGNSARALNSGKTSAVSDNGYLEILSTLGIPGSALFVSGIVLLLRPVFAIKRAACDSFVVVGKALALSTIPALLVGNCLIGSHGCYVGVLLSGAVASYGIRRLPDGGSRAS